jgi:hypothetical protein
MLYKFFIKIIKAIVNDFLASTQSNSRSLYELKGGVIEKNKTNKSVSNAFSQNPIVF